MNRNQATLSNRDYRSLNQYYGLIPGKVGSFRTAGGKLTSPPIPNFAPPMVVQTVPDYSKPSYIGTPSDLQHGRSANELNGGHFTVDAAYSPDCQRSQIRRCDGTVSQSTIPINDRVGCGSCGCSGRRRSL